MKLMKFVHVQVEFHPGIVFDSAWNALQMCDFMKVNMIQ